MLTWACAYSRSELQYIYYWFGSFLTVVTLEMQFVNSNGITHMGVWRSLNHSHLIVFPCFPVMLPPTFTTK